jgi:HTH-type transcriptional repressor of NAD biosynthesis genes
VSHALVIGKFYPPHAGHHHLIRSALAEADQVTVVVMAARSETLPLADRVAWLRAEHPEVCVAGVRCDAPFDLDDETVWSAQVAVMHAALRAVDAPPVDLVVSSEAYGEGLARRFGARHVLLDQGRSAVPVSGTQVRADLAGHWDSLAPAARAGLTTRVVLVGAESTGTTTIAGLIADAYRQRGGVWARTRSINEIGRERTVELAGDRPVGEIVWSAEDFDEIAAAQTAREDDAARDGSPLLVCDTDAVATAVWERRYLGQVRPQQPWAVLPTGRRLYLVTDHEGVPWVDDGLREGDLNIRAAMSRWFRDTLTAAGQSWVLLTGSIEQRLALAVRCCDRALADNATFGQPA